MTFTADADAPAARLKLSVSGAATGDHIDGKYRVTSAEFDFSGTSA